MKKRSTILLSILYLAWFSGIAQNSFKLFKDEQGNAVDSARAVFYSIYRSDPDTVLKSGSIETYFKNGRLLKRVDYKYGADGKRQDKETYYYENGKTGSVSNSVELQPVGEQLYYFPDGKLRCKVVYKENEMTTGQCFTRKGKDTTYYEVSNRLPEFPGGPAALQKFIRDKLQYPAEAKMKGISGTVELYVVIDRMGNIEKMAIQKGVDPLLDNEAIRVVRQMPQWIPGLHKDQLLPKYERIPVKFELK